MKNKSHKVVSVCLVLAFLLATSATAALAASENVHLLGARFISGKGLVVTLKVTEDTDTAQAASVVVNGVNYALDCQVGESIGKFLILHCVAGVPKEAALDAQATIWFGNDSFTDIVRGAREACYAVFDFPPGPSDPAFWGQIGTYCREDVAQPGDFIIFFNPDYGASYGYTFGTDCYGIPLGEGYYYGLCD